MSLPLDALRQHTGTMAEGTLCRVSCCMWRAADGKRSQPHAIDQFVEVDCMPLDVMRMSAVVGIP